MSSPPCGDITARWARQRQKDSKEHDEDMARQEAELSRKSQCSDEIAKIALFGPAYCGHSNLTVAQDTTVAPSLLPGYSLTTRDYQGNLLPAPALGVSSPTIQSPSVSISNPSPPFLGRVWSSPTPQQFFSPTCHNFQYLNHADRAEDNILQCHRLSHRKNDVELAADILMRIKKGAPVDMDSVMPDGEETEDEPLKEPNFQVAKPKNSKLKRAKVAGVTALGKGDTEKELGGTKKKRILILSLPSKPDPALKKNSAPKKTTIRAKKTKLAPNKAEASAAPPKTPTAKPGIASDSSVDTLNSTTTVATLTPMAFHSIPFEDSFTATKNTTTAVPGKGKRRRSDTKYTSPDHEMQQSTTRSPYGFAQPSAPPPGKRQQKSTASSTVSNIAAISANAMEGNKVEEKAENKIVEEPRRTSSGRVIKPTVRYG